MKVYGQGSEVEGSFRYEAFGPRWLRVQTFSEPTRCGRTRYLPDENLANPLLQCSGQRFSSSAVRLMPSKFAKTLGKY